LDQLRAEGIVAPTLTTTQTKHERVPEPAIVIHTRYEKRNNANKQVEEQQH